jgi:hypothetical protein
VDSFCLLNFAHANEHSVLINAADSRKFKSNNSGKSYSQGSNFTELSGSSGFQWLQGFFMSLDLSLLLNKL